MAVAVDSQTEQDDVMRAWLVRTGRTGLHIFTPGDDGFSETTIVDSVGGGFAWLSDDELLYADGNAVYRVNADGTNKRKVFP